MGEPGTSRLAIGLMKRKAPLLLPVLLLLPDFGPLVLVLLVSVSNSWGCHNAKEDTKAWWTVINGSTHGPNALERERIASFTLCELA